MKKIIFTAIVALLFPLFVGAVSVTVPAATGQGQMLISTTTGSTIGAYYNTNYPGDVLIIHPGGTTTPIVATTSSDVGRGTALLTAVSSARSGDTLQLASSTYNIQNHFIDMSFGGTGAFSLRGMGKYSTVIKASTPQPDIIITAASNSETTDLSIIGTAADGVTQYPWGVASGPLVNTSIRNVYLNAQSDGLFLAGGGLALLTVSNVTAVCRVDCASFSMTGTTTVYSSDFTSDDFNSGVWSRSAGIVIGNGTVNFFNSFATARGNTNENSAVLLSEGFSPAILNLYGSVLSSTGASALDFNFVAGPGTPEANVTANTIYDPTKKDGTVGFLDNAQIRYSLGSNGASSTVMVNQNGVANWQSTSTTQLGQWKTSGNDIYNTNTGKVGIGTSSPFALFSLNPTASFGTAPGFIIGSSTGTKFIVDNRGFSGFGTTSPYAYVSVNAPASIGSADQFIIGSSTATNLIVNNIGQMMVAPSGGSNPTSVTAGVGMEVRVANTTTWDRKQLMFGQGGAGGVGYAFGRDSGDGILYFSGNQPGYTGYNFLIGGATPGTGSSALTVSIDGLGSTDGRTGHVGVSSTTPWGFFSVNPQAGNLGPAMVVGSSTATLLIVDGGGKVGIATTSPQGKFEVATTTQSRAFGVSTQGQVQIGNAAPYFNTAANTAIVCYMSDGALGHITITSLLSSGSCVAN